MHPAQDLDAKCMCGHVGSSFLGLGFVVISMRYIHASNGASKGLFYSSFGSLNKERFSHCLRLCSFFPSIDGHISHLLTKH